MIRLKKFKLFKHPLLLLVVALILIGLGVYKYRLDHSPKKVVTVGTPVAAAATKNSNIQPKSQQANSLSSSPSTRNAGGATDTQGSTTPSTSPNQWTTSASGNITVKQPVANAILQDGSKIVGSAKVSQVNYRLKDNRVGVIAQGALSVSGGNFSGILHFQPQGTGGQLDIFSTDSSGIEYNEVQINVSF